MSALRIDVSGRSYGGTNVVMRAIRKLAKDPELSPYFVVGQGEKQMQMANYIHEDVLALRAYFDKEVYLPIFLEDEEGNDILYKD